MKDETKMDGTPFQYWTGINFMSTTVTTDEDARVSHLGDLGWVKRQRERMSRAVKPPFVDD